MAINRHLKSKKEKKEVIKFIKGIESELATMTVRERVFELLDNLPNLEDTLEEANALYMQKKYRKALKCYKEIYEGLKEIDENKQNARYFALLNCIKFFAATCALSVSPGQEDALKLLAEVYSKSQEGHPLPVIKDIYIQMSIEILLIQKTELMALKQGSETVENLFKHMLEEAQENKAEEDNPQELEDLEKEEDNPQEFSDLEKEEDNPQESADFEKDIAEIQALSEERKNKTKDISKQMVGIDKNARDYFHKNKLALGFFSAPMLTDASDQANDESNLFVDSDTLLMLQSSTSKKRERANSNNGETMERIVKKS